MTHARRMLTSVLVAVAGAALIAVVSVLPAMAQDQTGTGDVDNGRWSGSFDDPAMNEGATTVQTSSFTVNGTIGIKSNVLSPRGVESLELSADPADTELGCDSEVVGGRTDSSSPKSAPFSYTVTSHCNQVVDVKVTATDWFNSASMTAFVTVAVPPTPVTAVSAEVPDDGESRDVTVEWTPPETSEADTTYVAQRKAPESEEWTPVGCVEGEGCPASQESFVDTVEEMGVYQYRVVANRPLVDPVASEPVEVGVGVETPTSTTTTTSTSTTVPDGSQTTITQPEADPPVFKPSEPGSGRVSTHVTVTAPTRPTPTTIDTGYEETLEYPISDEEPGELAAEGQSILASEEESTVIGPGAVGAAAMVLIGWAGHVLYFRKLASQF